MIDSHTKVLIVDDDITSQRIMEKIIRISVGTQSFSCRRWLRSFENYAERASQFSYFRRCDAVHEIAYTSSADHAQKHRTRQNECTGLYSGC